MSVAEQSNMEVAVIRKIMMCIVKEGEEEESDFRILRWLRLAG